jgi:hypothetical protein
MLAQDHLSRLDELKKSVDNSYRCFRKNAERYSEFMRFVFDTALTNDDIQKLMTLKKPTIEFNIIEAIISRLLGEFAKHEPSIMVKAEDGVPLDRLSPEFFEMMHFIEAHIRHSIVDCETDGLQWKIYKDILGGGFSVVEIFTDYISHMSFDQKIVVSRVFDPTMTGFDPLARESHKGDGAYCYQLYPKTKAEFENEYGKKLTEGMKFARGIGPYELDWSYNQQDQDVVLVCEFYEKKKKKVKLLKLSNGHTVLKKHYENELLPLYEKAGFVEQPPIPVEERYTEIETIVRYRFCESQVLDYIETDYKYLPLVFIDGNSVDIRETTSGVAYQMTRPYAYHAKGIQQLKNFAGQTVGAEIENMVQHKFIVSVEAIPEDYKDAYRNIQQADTLVYNQFYDDDPNIRLDAPREVQRTQTPPIVESIFMGSDRVTQAILGAYDSVLGVNEKDVSGVAISNGAIQSSAASTPYLMGYIKGLNRIAQVMLDLIPKYYVTPRSLPIMTQDGKRSYQLINKPDDENSFDLRYQPHELNIRVMAGVNTSIQKQVAIDQIIKMMSASPLFAQFINTEGLETLLDNLEIRGIDEMKVKAAQFMKMLKEQQEQQSQQQDPMEQMVKAQMEVELARIEQKKQEMEGNLAIKGAQVAIDQQKTEIQEALALNEIELSATKIEMEGERLASENARSAVESAIEVARHHAERKTSGEPGQEG